MTTFLLTLAAFLTAILILWFFTNRRESFSDYNAPNEFMDMYYKYIAENPDLIKKYPYFGTEDKSGLRCKKPGNVGCSTIWLNGNLVERTPELNKILKCKFGL
jgi:hypothetical protein